MKVQRAASATTIGPGRRRVAQLDRQAGTGTVELVIVTPVLLMMLCLIVGLGRAADARGGSPERSGTPPAPQASPRPRPPQRRPRTTPPWPT